MLPTVIPTAPVMAIVPICVSKTIPLRTPKPCIHGYSGAAKLGS